MRRRPWSGSSCLQKMLNFQFDCLVDCVDDAAAKAVLAALCKTADVPMLMSGSAGGRLDPTRLKVADLSAVTNDKLLAKVRNVLRRDYAFPKASQTQKSAKFNTKFNTMFNTMFNISCVYSDEAVMAPETQSAQDTICALEKDTSLSQAVLPATLQASQASQESQESQAKNQSQAITGLNCAGYGSSVCVTAPMGFALAQLAINEIIKNRTKNCIKHTE